MEELKHSKLGVASFVISLVSAIALFIVILIAGYLSATGKNEDSVEVVFVGLGIIFFSGISFIAFILGIAALFQENVQKLFAAIGILFSSLTLLGVIFLMIIGLTAQ
jgi:ABC-type transport system involved in multi-copper enzyme maturation permease subunit